MSSSNNLPEELWSSVFKSMDRKEDGQTINSLRQTDKRFRRIAEPFCYWIVANHAPSKDQKKFKVLSPVECARLIGDKPELAKYVGEISLDRWGGRDEADPRSLPAGTPKPSRDQYQAVLDHTGLPVNIKDAILEELCRSTQDGYLSFLLATCTEIEILDFTRAVPIMGPLVMQLLVHVTDAHHVSQKTSPKGGTSILKLVRKISITDSFRQIPLAHVLTLLALPSLEDLALDYLSDTGDWREKVEAPPEWEVRSRDPINIILDHCLLTGPGLTRLLAACAFPHSLTARWKPGLWNGQLTNHEIGIAVMEAGSELRYLHLDTTDLQSVRRGGGPLQFGSFATLTNLRTLVLPSFVFSRDFNAKNDASILPSSLETLYVLGVDGSGRETVNGNQANVSPGTFPCTATSCD
jgi:hypothetical protein